MFKNTKGFSLLELVVAISLLVLLLVSLSMIFTAGLGIYQNQGKGIYPFKEARNIFQNLESDFLSAIDGTNLFRGNTGPTRMDFITQDIEEGILAIRYQYDAGGEILQRITEETNSYTLPNNISSQADEIGQNITSCVFTFYGGQVDGMRLDPDDSDASWTNANTPAAIRVDLTIKDIDNPKIIETFTRIFALRNRT